MDFKNAIENYVKQELEVIRKLNIESVNDALNLLLKTREANGTVYVLGNGGSSATASHFQNDFNKGVSENIEKKFRFICLNDNIPTLMAIANDNGFENVFSQQLENKLTQDDIVIAISGSGNSKNVIKAVEYAKLNGNKVIGLSGYNGGKLRELSDISLHVPIDNMQITEDVHLIYNHMMMYVLWKELEGMKNE